MFGLTKHGLFEVARVKIIVHKKCRLFVISGRWRHFRQCAKFLQYTSDEKRKKNKYWKWRSCLKRLYIWTRPNWHEGFKTSIWKGKFEFLTFSRLDEAIAVIDTDEYTNITTCTFVITKRTKISSTGFLV